MGTGTKVTVAFLAGAAVGAAALAYLNRDKLDIEGMKSLAADWLNKGIELKDSLFEKLNLQKKDGEDLMAEEDLDESLAPRSESNQGS